MQLKPSELTKDEAEKVDVEARKNFWFFTKHIFAESFPSFIGGQHVENTCSFLEKNKKTVRISAKDHFKSTSLYAHFAWIIWKHGETRNFEGHYFSYERNMAAYHLSKMKDLLARNPWFEGLKDMKAQAESVLSYTFDGKHKFTLKPHGMLAFKRGIHADGIYVDDPFQDPENKLDPTKVDKINQIFTTQIMDMPKKNAFLHVVGTPQTTKDFFFNKNLMQRFEVTRLPAILDKNKKKVLWPEHMNFNELMIRRSERGSRVFNQEYLCRPFSGEHAWFKKKKISDLVNPELKNIFAIETDNIVSLGMDVGKKVHPSHVAIFEKVGNRWIQRYHEFMDGIEYHNQVMKVNDLIERFKVNYGFYDSTRGELEGFVEQDLFSPIMKPVHFDQQSKFKMAANFDRIATEKRVELIKDERMLNQILVVDTNLDAIETKEGHGEPFWSIALALSCEFMVKPPRPPVLLSIAAKRDKQTILPIQAHGFMRH